MLTTNVITPWNLKKARSVRQLKKVITSTKRSSESRLLITIKLSTILKDLEKIILSICFLRWGTRQHTKIEFLSITRKILKQVANWNGVHYLISKISKLTRQFNSSRHVHHKEAPWKKLKRKVDQAFRVRKSQLDLWLRLKELKHPHNCEWTKKLFL